MEDSAAEKPRKVVVDMVEARQRRQMGDPLKTFNDVFVPIILGLSLQVMIVSAFAPQMVNSRVGFAGWPLNTRILFWLSLAFIIKYVQGNSVFAHRLGLHPVQHDARIIPIGPPRDPHGPTGAPPDTAGPSEPSPWTDSGAAPWYGLMGFASRVVFLVLLPLFVITSFYYPLNYSTPSQLEIAFPVLSGEALVFGALLLFGYWVPNFFFLIGAIGWQKLWGLWDHWRCLRDFKVSNPVEVQQSWWMLNLLTFLAYVLMKAVPLPPVTVLLVVFGINVIFDWFFNREFYFGS